MATKQKRAKANRLTQLGASAIAMYMRDHKKAIEEIKDADGLQKLIQTTCDEAGKLVTLAQIREIGHWPKVNVAVPFMNGSGVVVPVTSARFDKLHGAYVKLRLDYMALVERVTELEAQFQTVKRQPVKRA